MNQVTGQRTPWHIWATGGLTLLWNAIGAADYTMTHAGGADYLAKNGFGPEVIAYFDTLPLWATAGWAMGVWGGVLGSLLLLFRSRFAVLAFALSLLGIAMMTVNSFINPYPAAMVSNGMTAFEWMIKFVAALLLWYAWTLRKRGFLR